jgi:hypothetical protein
MRYAFTILVLGTVCGLGNVLAQSEAEKSEKPGASDRESPMKEKPLLLDDEPLLLLDDEPLLLLDDGAGGAPIAESGADNSRCHVCHLNFTMEEIAVTHAKEDIGCGDCHGECDEHIDDESWATGGPGTPPGIMYPPEKIDPACRECHDTHDAPAHKILKRWQERCPRKTDPSTIVCTDCHGRHRIKSELRHAWWDKRTGKPIKPHPTSNARPAADGRERG